MALNKTKDGRPMMTQMLLLANLIVMSLSSYRYLKSIDDGTAVRGEEASILPQVASSLEDRGKLSRSKDPQPSAVSIASDQSPEVQSNASRKGPAIADTPPGGVGQLHSGGVYFVKPREGERDFYETAKTTRTDKVTVPGMLSQVIPEYCRDCVVTSSQLTIMPRVNICVLRLQRV